MTTDSTSIDINRILRSIDEQTHELKRRSQEPRFVLLNHETMYAIQHREGLLLLPKDPLAPPRLFGLDIHVTSWLPTGLAIVTDDYASKPILTAKKAEWTMSFGRDYIDATAFGDTSRTYLAEGVAVGSGGISGTFSTSSDFDVSEIYEKIAKAYKIDPLSLGFDPAKPAKPAKKKAPMKKDEVWAERITEAQEPDPESIFGKALARAREDKKLKTP